MVHTWKNDKTRKTFCVLSGLTLLLNPWNDMAAAVFAAKWPTESWGGEYHPSAEMQPTHGTVAICFPVRRCEAHLSSSVCELRNFTYSWRVDNEWVFIFGRILPLIQAEFRQVVMFDVCWLGLGSVSRRLSLKYKMFSCELLHPPGFYGSIYDVKTTFCCHTLHTHSPLVCGLSVSRSFKSSLYSGMVSLFTFQVSTHKGLGQKALPSVFLSDPSTFADFCDLSSLY